ncbi:hypothetical protein J6590_038668 [Homalodisca vitripennis]|nr:hypothetical protein J6590_038668 [Homalodisca vitripennis]
MMWFEFGGIPQIEFWIYYWNYLHLTEEKVSHVIFRPRLKDYGSPLSQRSHNQISRVITNHGPVSFRMSVCLSVSALVVTSVTPSSLPLPTSTFHL